MITKTIKKLLNHKSVLPLGLTLIIVMMITTSVLETDHRENSSKEMLDTISQQNLNSSLLQIMSQAILNRTIILIQILHSDDPFINDELSLDLYSLATSYVDARTKLSKQNLDPELKRMINKIDPLSRENGPIQYKVYELVQQDERGKAMALFTTASLPNQREVFKIIKQMEDYQLSIGANAIESRKNHNHGAHEKIKVFNILSILISILLTFFIVKRQSISDNKLTYQASTDILTKLPNRASFVKLTDKQIKNNPSQSFAIVFFDIDYFKSINDNYGHETGDEVLKYFSSKVNALTKDEDILARFGGDEFVLLLRSPKTEARIRKQIRKISTSLDTSCTIDDNEIFISASMGVSLYSPEAANTKTLLKNADIAMYSAKTTGRNCFKFYSKETNNKLEQEHHLSHALHTILKNNNQKNELYIMYQPLLNITTGKTSDCEALIRWKNASGENISPEEFIPLAEKSNLIEKINSFVINETCKQQQKWQLSDRENIRININLSGNKRIFTHLLRQFKYNLIRMNLHPTLFGIELTERTINDIAPETIVELEQLREQGLKISIDDFGTDYSSLMNLKKLPITTLKIDKGFIDGLPNNKDDKALVKTIITLGHALDLDVVAEGVEMRGQLAFLKEQGCNSIQGYYYQYPLKDKHILPLLKSAS